MMAAVDCSGTNWKARGQRHAQLLLGRQQVEDQTVIVQVRDGRVAPRVALALALLQAELAADMAVQVFCGWLRRSARPGRECK